MNKSEVIQKVDEENVNLVRFVYVGNDGVARGYAAKSSDLESQMETGMALSDAMQSFNALDHLVPEGRFGAAGEVRIVPDPDTFRVLPYPPGTAMMVSDLYKLDKKPWDACPRSICKDILSDTEFSVKSVFEDEFYFAQEREGNVEPLDQSMCFSTQGMNSANEPIQEIIDALETVGISVERYLSEYGAGQQEIVFAPREGLQAADQQVIFKEVVGSLAQKYGLKASFMPKPFQNLAGSGAHIHISLWKNGENVFADPSDRYGLSEIAYSFIGGVLDHLEPLMAFSAPISNSYRRLIPGNWAGAFNCYGYDNREAAIRIPSQFWGQEKDSTNLEFKIADPSCNPYLTLGGLLGAGLDGISRNLDPGEPVNKDPQLIDEKTRKSEGITRLPRTLGESLTALREDSFFRELFGSTLYEEYIKVKESEWRECRRHVPQWERDNYFDIF